MFKLEASRHRASYEDCRGITSGAASFWLELGDSLVLGVWDFVGFHDRIEISFGSSLVNDFFRFLLSRA
jgi:hypothetical protein